MIWIAASALLALAGPAARAEGDAENGRRLAYTCMGCHGIENYKNAYPKYSVPKLGGQNQLYVIAALGEYASGNRWHPTMQGLAISLSKTEREDLAAWFTAAAPLKPGARQVGNPPKVAEACTACHGKDGLGTLDEYPNLAGQHADYLQQALNDYRLGKRKSPIMNPFAQQLTREEIAAISSYYSKQQGLATLEQD
ncbi:MAG: c-type cytochrome [Steroidobacteraceae bacterium]